MNFTERQKAWLKLISLVVGTGAAVTATSYMGGCKVWVAVLVGVGTAGSNVYHALTDAPTPPAGGK
jgi:hypothetical protein